MFGTVELRKNGLVKAKPGPETDLLEAVTTGDLLTIPGKRDVTDLDAWTDKQTIRADVLRHICLKPDLYDMDPKGVMIAGARISGILNLQFANLNQPLTIIQSRFDKEPNLQNCSLPVLMLNNSFLPGLRADGLTCGGDIFLKEVQAKGEVRLLGADIKGNLSCQKAKFNNEGKMAFSVDRLTCGGDVFLKEVQAQGAVRLLGADIKGNLSCQNGKFNNEDGTAFHADRLTCGGSVFLKEVHAHGEVRLLGADITGNLSCHNGKFNNEGKMAFSADRLTCGGDVFLKEVQAQGAVRLPGADIKGNLSCHNGKFNNENKMAFSADGLICGGDVFLNEVQAQGEVRLLGADITGDLSCEKAAFKNPDGAAIVAEHLNVKNVLFWQDVTIDAKSSVNFRKAHVGDLIDDQYSWPQAGQLTIDGFTYDNLVQSIKVEERISWLSLMYKTGDFFDPKQLRDGIQFFRKTGESQKARDLEWLALQYKFEPEFIPQPYEQMIKILRDSGHLRDARLIAIAKQDAYRSFLKAQDVFKSKLDAFKNNSPESFDYANKDKNKKQTLRAYALRTSNVLRRLWFWFLYHTARYGYEPWRAFYFLAGFWLAGTLIFGWADGTGYMRPAKERIVADARYSLQQRACLDAKWQYVTALKGEQAMKPMCIPEDYTAFHTITYSIDTLIPIVDLHQETYWEPGNVGWKGGFFRLYMWFHIIAGWVFTTVAVAGFTGLIKKD